MTVTLKLNLHLAQRQSFSIDFDLQFHIKFYPLISPPQHQMDVFTCFHLLIELDLLPDNFCFVFSYQWFRRRLLCNPHVSVPSFTLTESCGSEVERFTAEMSLLESVIRKREMIASPLLSSLHVVFTINTLSSPGSPSFLLFSCGVSVAAVAQMCSYIFQEVHVSYGKAFSNIVLESPVFLCSITFKKLFKERIN